MKLELDTAALAETIAESLAARLGAKAESWIGVEEAAAHLACRRQRIYNLVSAGRLPCRRDGGRLLFRRSELDAYVEGDM